MGGGKKIRSIFSSHFRVSTWRSREQNIRAPEKNVCTAGYILGSDARVTSNGSEAFPILSLLGYFRTQDSNFIFLFLNVRFGRCRRRGCI